MSESDNETIPWLSAITGSSSTMPKTTIPQWRLDLFGGKDSEGAQVNGSLPTGMAAFSGLAGAYLGWQQFNLAKDQMEQNKKIFNLNFGAQAQSTNRELEDRQMRRHRDSGGASESAESYMARNRVNAKGI